MKDLAAPHCPIEDLLGSFQIGAHQGWGGEDFVPAWFSWTLTGKFQDSVKAFDKCYSEAAEANTLKTAICKAEEGGQPFNPQKSFY